MLAESSAGGKAVHGLFLDSGRDSCSRFVPFYQLFLFCSFSISWHDSCYSRVRMREDVICVVRGKGPGRPLARARCLAGPSAVVVPDSLPRPWGHFQAHTKRDNLFYSDSERVLFES